jgi:predicted RecA/RadA family phage recombinase
MTTKSYVSGDIVQCAAPSGGVTSGLTYVIGGMILVALSTAAEGVTCAFARTGVHTQVKVGSQAWAVGDKLYWDDGNSRWTKTVADGLVLGGVAYEVAGSGAGVTTGKVLLVPGIAPSTAAGTYAFAAGTNLTAVPGTFADEAAVQTYLVTLRAEIEARLDAQDVANVAVRAILVENGLIPNA